MLVAGLRFGRLAGTVGMMVADYKLSWLWNHNHSDTHTQQYRDLQVQLAQAQRMLDEVQVDIPVLWRELSITIMMRMLFEIRIACSEN